MRKWHRVRQLFFDRADSATTMAALTQGRICLTPPARDRLPNCSTRDGAGGHTQSEDQDYADAVGEE